GVLVKGGDHRVAERGWELAVVQDQSVRGAELADQSLVVAEVDAGLLLEHGRLDLRDGRLRVRVRAPGRAQDHDSAKGRRDDAQDLLPAPVPPPAALTARRPATGAIPVAPTRPFPAQPPAGWATRRIPVRR